MRRRGFGRGVTDRKVLLFDIVNVQNWPAALLQLRAAVL
jgi:hypothetical protein